MKSQNFNYNKIIYIIIASTLILLFGGILFLTTRQSRNSFPPISLYKNNANDINYNIKDECANNIHKQKIYLQNETLANTETFEKYKTTSTLISAPAVLNVNSNKFAKKFRTNISFGLKNEGVNFAGTYTIVNVGMTGGGSNFYIIDRKNGDTYLFQYFTDYLDFKKDSNLLIMNPKKELLNIINGVENEYDLCFYENQQWFPDMRPFYFLWKDNQLILIGPHDIEPPRNQFWNTDINSI